MVDITHKNRGTKSTVLFFKSDINVERVVESSAQANVFFGRETNTGVKVVVKQYTMHKFKGIFRDSLEFGVKDFVFLGDDQVDPMAWLEKFKQIEERSKEYVIALSGLILQGVNWDFGR